MGRLISQKEMNRFKSTRQVMTSLAEINASKERQSKPRGMSREQFILNRKQLQGVIGWNKYDAFNPPTKNIYGVEMAHGDTSVKVLAMKGDSYANLHAKCMAKFINAIGRMHSSKIKTFILN